MSDAADPDREPEADPDPDPDHGAGPGVDTGDENGNGDASEDREIDTSHLDDIEDGCGCAEVWEHLSASRAAGPDD